MVDIEKRLKKLEELEKAIADFIKYSGGNFQPYDDIQFTPKACEALARMGVECHFYKRYLKKEELGRATMSEIEDWAEADDGPEIPPNWSIEGFKK